MRDIRLWTACMALLWAMGCYDGQSRLGLACGEGGGCPNGQVCNAAKVCVEANNDADGDGVLVENGDCDDADPNVLPGAEEVPYDGIDNDCADGDLVDVDGDGHTATEAGGTDCNDADSAINTDATEVCNLVDDDCDGNADLGGQKLLEKTLVTESTTETTSTQFHPNGQRMQLDRRIETPTTIQEWSLAFDEAGNPLLDSYRRDDNKDGTWDASNISSWDYDYDADGNAVVARRDIGDDASVELIVTYTYDDSGRRVSEASDFDADGTVDGLNVVAYDVNSKMTQSRFESPPGSLSYEYTWAYDAAGNAVEQRRLYPNNLYVDTYEFDDEGNRLLHGYTRDNGADGSIDYVFERHYNPAGATVLYLEDSDGDGQWSYQETRGFNADGNETFFRRESPYVDGTSPTYEQLWSYNSQTGYLELHTRDPDGAGPTAVNYKITYTNDANGMTSAVFNTNNIGPPEYQNLFQHDANGNQTMFGYENPYNAGNSINYSYHYEYDVNNNRTRLIYYNGAPLVANALYQYIYIYDDDGHRTYYGSDSPYGGPLESTETWEFDPQGNPTRYEEDSNGDGTPDSVVTTTYEYDATGNMLYRAQDQDDDGTDDTVQAWEYSPACELVPRAPLVGDAHACYVGGANRCFKPEPVTDYDGATCHCDSRCVTLGDCCADYGSRCVHY